MRALTLTPADALRLALLAALGLPAFTACGGTVDTKDGSSADGGASSGGANTGGAIGSGGRSSGGTSSGGAIGTGGDFGTGGASDRCTAQEVLMPGYATGFFKCAEGYEHRQEVRDCPSFLPRTEEQPEQPVPDGQPDTDECDFDSDCPGPNGYCAPAPIWFGGLGYGNVCATGCVSDSDCAANQICHCGDPIGTCVATAPAGQGCTTDADCGGDYLCAYVPQIGCGSGAVFACQKPEDECETRADCPDVNDDCALSYDGSGTRVCQPAPVCGRPFLVDFLERRAEPAGRSDWTLSARMPKLTSLDAATKSALADHWTDIALMEHASIAAFARFSLQLLSLGAPADLIEDTNRALIDETKHARLCFALASTYRGSAVGPSALTVQGSLEGSSPEAILRTVIREGCLGETHAALEAAEAGAACEDAAVAEVLEVIAADEARHAELAWRFVQWLLSERPELRAVAREEFVAALASLGGPLPSAEQASLSRHGVLSARAREGIRRRAITTVLSPCADGLLAARGAERPPLAFTRVSHSTSLAVHS